MSNVYYHAKRICQSQAYIISCYTAIVIVISVGPSTITDIVLYRVCVCYHRRTDGVNVSVCEQPSRQVNTIMYIFSEPRRCTTFSPAWSASFGIFCRHREGQIIAVHVYTERERNNCEYCKIVKKYEYNIGFVYYRDPTAPTRLDYMCYNVLKLAHVYFMRRHASHFRKLCSAIDRNVIDNRVREWQR